MNALAGNAARAAAPRPCDPMAQLHYAALGTTNADPMTLDDSDDEIEFGGSRSLGPGMGMYAGQEDLYNSRYDEILSHDPERTREEINALLDNIRPDEELPDNLLVRKPREHMGVSMMFSPRAAPARFPLWYLRVLLQRVVTRFRPPHSCDPLTAERHPC